jgi:hypothetical protein
MELPQPGKQVRRFSRADSRPEQVDSPAECVGVSHHAVVHFPEIILTALEAAGAERSDVSQRVQVAEPNLQRLPAA